jgi:MFS family permease
MQVSSSVPAKSTSLRVVVLLGIVSLFGDVVYEGARSISGPYLATFGATGAIIGFTAGFAEMLGYIIRLVSGKVAGDRRFIWPSIWLGYILNLTAVPCLALANSWVSAAGLVFVERLGKGVRTPGRDVVLSEAAGDNKGFAFGLHHALDQTGAIAGPLIVAAIISMNHSYRTALAFLTLPAIISLICLSGARKQAGFMSPPAVTTTGASKLPRQFWMYSIALAFIGAGFIDFPLIAFNLSVKDHMPPNLIPLVYALAMAGEAVMAVPMGKLFDRYGINLLRVLAWVTVPVSLTLFSSRIMIVLIGSVIWGACMVFQNSLAKAMVAHLVPSQDRSIAYGAFGLVYGICWFAGSFAIGLLYDRHVTAAVGTSIALEACGALLLLFFRFPKNQI